MNDYERKLEAKRERLERASDKASEASTAAFQRAQDATRGIEFGQPILVGHHSEGRHRGALRRSDNAMRKSVELTKKAAELAHRAEAVGTGGISSDDPDAVPKLESKLEAMEKKRDHMKKVNALYKKKDVAGLAAMGLSYETLVAEVAGNFSWDKRPYASYELTNLGARIRDAKKRAEQLAPTAEHRESAPPEPETIGSLTITVDPQELRVLIASPAKLPTEDYKRIRSIGFVWSPTRKAFVRKYNPATLYGIRCYAQRAAAEILARTTPTTQEL